MNRYDVVVIGSGFGGSVAALRLTERGYRVLVIEAGARFADADFAKTSWQVRKFFFFPKLGCTGIQRMDLLSNVLVMSGAGVGGGSLVYANTLYRPSEAFYTTGSWAGVANWKSLLEPYYRQAEQMLGVVTNPYESPADRVLRKVAESEGFGASYTPAPVGIYFGDGAGAASKDPFFGGVGPNRVGCLNCGECMTGCRHNAKNTLVKNYLYLAEQGGQGVARADRVAAGAEVWPLTTVTDLERTAEGGWVVRSRATARGGFSRRVAADQVIVAAGALGSARLLQRLRDRGRLPGISNQLGQNTRTNSESLLGVISRTDDIDFTAGSAITSSVYPSPDTHIEPVRYGKGSNLMATLQAFMASGSLGQSPNVWRVLGATLRNLHNLPKFYNFRHWSERTLILLVMQARDNSLTTKLKRGLFGKRLVSTQGYGEPNPSWVPAGHKFARAISAEINGIPGAVATEAFGIPLTAHFLGGATIGADATSGVVDGYLRVFGEPGLHIFDGSTLSANPGVNPSLSIVAQAEWACAHWPNLGEPDLRPALGAAFEVSPVTAPMVALVPEHAPAALRLPLR